MKSNIRKGLGSLTGTQNGKTRNTGNTIGNTNSNGIWDERQSGMYDTARIINDAFKRVYGPGGSSGGEGSLPGWLKQTHADYEAGRIAQNSPAPPAPVSKTIAAAPASTPKIRPDGWIPDGFRQLTEAFKEGWQPDETTAASRAAAPNCLSVRNTSIQEPMLEYRPGDVTPMRRLIQKMQQEDAANNANSSTGRAFAHNTVIGSSAGNSLSHRNTETIESDNSPFENGSYYTSTKEQMKKKELSPKDKFLIGLKIFQKCALDKNDDGPECKAAKKKKCDYLKKESPEAYKKECLSTPDNTDSIITIINAYNDYKFLKDMKTNPGGTAWKTGITKLLTALPKKALGDFYDYAHNPTSDVNLPGLTAEYEAWKGHPKTPIDARYANIPWEIFQKIDDDPNIPGTRKDKLKRFLKVNPAIWETIEKKNGGISRDEVLLFVAIFTMAPDILYR